MTCDDTQRYKINEQHPLAKYKNKECKSALVRKNQQHANKQCINSFPFQKKECGVRAVRI